MHVLLWQNGILALFISFFVVFLFLFFEKGLINLSSSKLNLDKSSLSNTKPSSTSMVDTSLRMIYVDNIRKKYGAISFNFAQI